MSPIKVLPELKWSDRARKEILASAAQVMAQSDLMWQLGKAAVAGLIYETYTSPPWMWFALAEDVTMRDLIDFRRLQVLIPRGSLTAVEVGHEVEHRFATFYGFEPTDDEREHAGLIYRIYRRA